MNQELNMEMPPSLGAGEKQNTNALTFDSDGALSGEEGQGDLEKAKEWLGKTVCEATGYDDWDGTGPDGQEIYISDTWSALVAVHGEESAKMVLLSKWSDVTKGGQP